MQNAAAAHAAYASCATTSTTVMVQGPPEWNPAPPHVRETCKKAVHAATKRGADITALAIKFSLQNEDLATTLVRCVNMWHACMRWS